MFYITFPKQSSRKQKTQSIFHVFSDTKIPISMSWGEREGRVGGGGGGHKSTRLKNQKQTPIPTCVFKAETPSLSLQRLIC